MIDKTLRDEFAMMALQGFCSMMKTLPEKIDYPAILSEAAYRYADAMLRARKGVFDYPVIQGCSLCGATVPYPDPFPHKPGCPETA